jgi:dimeric dUTPase (all-alpha-NTP-PPase superfamily)
LCHGSWLVKSTRHRYNILWVLITYHTFDTNIKSEFSCLFICLCKFIRHTYCENTSEIWCRDILKFKLKIIFLDLLYSFFQGCYLK